MAFINQETKKQIAQQLKPIFAKHGIKATLGIDNHSTLVVKINKAQYDFLKNYSKKTGNNCGNYLSINPYWFNEHFTGKCKTALNEIMDTIKNVGKWYDNSDIMTDYFDTKFYIDINIGQWNKPFELI